MLHAIRRIQMQQNQFNLVLRPQVLRDLGVNNVSVGGMLFPPAPLTESGNIDPGFGQFVCKA